MKIKDGLTASIEIESNKVRAHKISPSILSLKDNGEIGVKIVDEKNIDKFYPINIVSDTNSGMWISGIPDNSKIIVCGDWCMNGKVEGAFLSAKDAVIKILNYI